MFLLLETVMSVSAVPRSSWRQILASVVQLQPSPGSRLLFSARAGLSVALPVLVGSLLGYPSMGMLAALGGLTSLYGNERPYRARAVVLLLVTVAFALAVGLGSAVGHALPWIVVPLVAVFAMLATWLCNALRMGPPGAYLFMLACAGGSAIPTGGLSDAEVTALVFAGGLGAWCLHMVGALFDRHGPETRAVSAAGAAVRHLIQSPPEERRECRRRASLAVHEAWQALVAWQPRAGGGTQLARLRGINRQWHLLLAGLVDGRIDADRALARADELDGWLDLSIQMPDAKQGVGSLPLGRPGALALLGQVWRPGSHERDVILRVGVAAVAAGTLASLAGLERAYWAIGAAVLMLHTGSNWTQTVVRASQRLLGTWTGLLLTAVVLWWQPQGLWMAALLFVLQFTIEMLVMRNYALAAVFITATGMTLATGGQPQIDPSAFLLARGLDTLLGCGVALAVLRLMPTTSVQERLDDGLQQTLEAAVALNSHLAWAELTSATARQVRARLGHHVHALDVAWEQGRRLGTPGSERSGPVVMAVQELAYRLLATAWLLEHAEEAPAQARRMYGRGGVAAVQAALRELSAAIAGQRAPGPLPALPDFVASELAAVSRALPDGGSSLPSPGIPR